MKTNEIMKKASGLFHRTRFKIQQSSPEILIIGGIIGCWLFHVLFAI